MSQRAPLMQSGGGKLKPEATGDEPWLGGLGGGVRAGGGKREQRVWDVNTRWSQDHRS